MTFKPALIVVDVQNDFCPPDGSLAISGGRDIVPLINKLISCPAFQFRAATRDYHPANHVSFASNHPPPNNKPFESYVEISNIVAGKPDETIPQRLWPVHCVQNTKGCELVDELDATHFDVIVLKGTDHRVEMYSAFTDVFGNMTAGAGGVSHDLAKLLHEHNITHVYVVGIAGNYCVKDTALGASQAGFTTYIIEEAQRGSDPENWPDMKRNLAAKSVKVVSINDEEVKRLGSF